MKYRKCRECANFLPIEGTVYGHCKVRPFAVKQGGKKATDKEFLVTRGRIACKKDFVEGGEPPKVVKTCRRCGKNFEVQQRSRRQFCCDECRVKWYRETKKRQYGECQMCGKPLEGHQRKFCLECAGKKHKPVEQKAEKPKKRKVLSISEINTRALAEHLSYGEYVMKYGV